jgi:hypothetical protein
MQVNNLDISREESEAMKEKRFFLLKDSATKKLIDLFGRVEAELKKEVLESGTKYISGKNFPRRKLPAFSLYRFGFSKDVFYQFGFCISNDVLVGT